MSDGGAVNRRRGYVIGDGLSGGFWRRVIAFWIDHALVGLVLSLIGAAAFAATDGGIRYSRGGSDVTHCVPLNEAASRNTDRLKRLPAAGPMQRFRPDRPPDEVRMAQCETLLPSHKAVRVAFVWRGRPSYRETVENPLSPSGRVLSRTLDLGALFLPMLLVWLAFSEAAWGGGPGKRLMGLRVIHRDGINPARFRATLARNALLYGPAAGFSLTAAVQTLLGSPPGDIMFGWSAVVFGTAAAIWSLWVLVGVLLQRPDPFWDRWSGVSVRRRVWIEDR